MRWWCVLSLLLIAGCGDRHEDLEKWIQESTRDLVGRVPPVSEMKPTAVVSYTAGNLPDPFGPAKIETARKPGGGGGLRPDLNRPKEPLEAFPLESLKMVGALQRGKNLYALIQADKSIYQSRVGNYIGQNFGVITAISENEVTLKELVQDSAGDWVERTSSLLLQEQEAKK
ncbi:MAG: pilus assembly protein PilP [Rhodocyclaceae bacterium]|nr:pilus assembly protein PilP [Rhodocyclaceae bacterium]